MKTSQKNLLPIRNTVQTDRVFVMIVNNHVLMWAGESFFLLFPSHTHTHTHKRPQSHGFMLASFLIDLTCRFLDEDADG